MHKFANNYPFKQPTGFWTWLLSQASSGSVSPEPFTSSAPAESAARFLRDNAFTLTWIGHATTLLRFEGLTILTDPIWGERASPFPFVGPKRIVPAPVSMSDLPHVDIVVVSHNHYDHLDRGTIQQLARQAGGSPEFFVPRGLRSWFESIGVSRVIEFDWWQFKTRGQLTLHFVPVQHGSGRLVIDRNHSLWGGWVVKSPRLSFVFLGDIGYSKDIKDVAERLGPFHVAAIPIGGYLPRAFHLTPQDAVAAFKDLNPMVAVPIHWGTFTITSEPYLEPLSRLDDALRQHGIARDRFPILAHGQSIGASWTNR